MASLLRSAAAAARHLRLAHPRLLAAAPPSRFDGFVSTDDGIPVAPLSRSKSNKDDAPHSHFLHRRDGVVRQDLPVNWGFAIVPERKAYVIERLGKYKRTLGTGIHFLLPIADRVAYVHSLKEEVFPIKGQLAITKDKVCVGVHGVVSYKIVDPILASYVVEDPVEAAINLTESVLIEEFGRTPYNKTSEMRTETSNIILRTLNRSTEEWGIMCSFCDIRDVIPQAELSQLALLGVLVDHKKLLHSIYEEVKMSAKGIEQSESFIKATLAEACDLNTSTWWKTLLMSLFQAIFIVLGSGVLAMASCILRKYFNSRTGGSRAIQKVFGLFLPVDGAVKLYLRGTKERLRRRLMQRNRSRSKKRKQQRRETRRRPRSV